MICDLCSIICTVLLGRYCVIQNSCCSAMQIKPLLTWDERSENVVELVDRATHCLHVRTLLPHVGCQVWTWITTQRRLRFCLHIRTRDSMLHHREWVSKGLTSHSTLYMSFWGRFLQDRQPTNSVKALKEASWPLRWASIPPEPLHRVTIWTVGNHF